MNYELTTFQKEIIAGVENSKVVPTSDFQFLNYEGQRIGVLKGYDNLEESFQFVLKGSSEYEALVAKRDAEIMEAPKLTTHIEINNSTPGLEGLQCEVKVECKGGR